MLGEGQWSEAVLELTGIIPVWGTIKAIWDLGNDEADFIYDTLHPFDRIRGTNGFEVMEGVTNLYSTLDPSEFNDQPASRDFVIDLVTSYGTMPYEYKESLGIR